MDTLKLELKQQQNIFTKMEKAMPKWIKQIDNRFMSESFKDAYKSIIKKIL